MPAARAARARVSFMGCAAPLEVPLTGEAEDAESLSGPQQEPTVFALKQRVLAAAVEAGAMRVQDAVIGTKSFELFAQGREEPFAECASLSAISDQEGVNFSDGGW